MCCPSTTACKAEQPPCCLYGNGAAMVDHQLIFQVLSQSEVLCDDSGVSMRSSASAICRASVLSAVYQGVAGWALSGTMHLRSSALLEQGGDVSGPTDLIRVVHKAVLQSGVLCVHVHVHADSNTRVVCVQERWPCLSMML